MSGIAAKMVWNNLDPSQLDIPESMGTPREDQLQGTPGEKLCELCGRCCYDSLGKGRSSEDYHKHISEVRHYSTVEHFNLTVEVSKPHSTKTITNFLNRKGVWVELAHRDTFRVTYNPRVILDWHKHGLKGAEHTSQVYYLLKHEMNKAVPQIVPPVSDKELASINKKTKWTTVYPVHEHEIWVSCFMRGSRGFSHEQVRHRNPVSQRSTRYCDESESEWILHPLYEQYVNNIISNTLEDPPFMESYNLIYSCKAMYNSVVEKLQKYLLDKGVDKLTARKQARGAARGFLGNALATELIMSASIWDWHHMFDMRMTDAADAEIRLVYNSLYEDLLKGNLKDYFKKDTRPSSDGLGFVLEKPYHADLSGE